MIKGSCRIVERRLPESFAVFTLSLVEMKADSKKPLLDRIVGFLEKSSYPVRNVHSECSKQKEKGWVSSLKEDALPNNNLLVLFSGLWLRDLDSNDPLEEQLSEAVKMVYEFNNE